MGPFGENGEIPRETIQDLLVAATLQRGPMPTTGRAAASSLVITPEGPSRQRSSTWLQQGPPGMLQFCKWVQIHMVSLTAWKGPVQAITVEGAF